MSRRHQASRRRSYGRRQHELHERPEVRRADRSFAVDGLDTSDADARRGVRAEALSRHLRLGFAD